MQDPLTLYSDSSMPAERPQRSDQFCNIFGIYAYSSIILEGEIFIRALTKKIL